jgi:Tfp pilus assembly protein FimT
VKKLLLRAGRGLSFVEMLVSLLIMGLVAFLSLPQNAVYLGAGSLRLAAEELANKVQSISLLSKQTNTPVLIELTRTGYSLWQLKKDRKTNLIETRVNKKGVLLELPSARATRAITCYPSGACTPLSFRILKGSQSCNMKVSLRGRVRLSCE